jgi:deoxyribonuclease V
VGCGKSLLYGFAGEPGLGRGDRSPILSEDGRTLGMALRTREGVKPIFVSPGHRIGCEAAAEWALRTSLGYRVPQPIRLAHLLVNRRRGEIERRGRR